jgi:hypothetical protein
LVAGAGLAFAIGFAPVVALSAVAAAGSDFESSPACAGDVIANTSIPIAKTEKTLATEFFILSALFDPDEIASAETSSGEK